MGNKPECKISYRGLSISAWENDDSDKRPHVSLQRSKKIDGSYVKPHEVPLWYSSINVLYHMCNAFLKEYPEFLDDSVKKDIKVEKS